MLKSQKITQFLPQLATWQVVSGGSVDPHHSFSITHNLPHDKFVGSQIILS